jgi:hypothetical protein
MYSSTLSLASVRNRDVWLTPLSGLFTPGNEKRYLLYKRLCGPQSWSGREGEISPPSVFDSRTVQLVAIRHTGYAVPDQKQDPVLPTNSLP